MNMTRTRFAPSPTGFLHIGGLRTAAYAYALAKRNDGQFLLRIEDTDQKREVEGSREKIMETLTQFGMHWDELYIQSERVKTGVYQKAAESLLASGHAFYCQCPPRNAKTTGERISRDPCRDKKFTSGAIKLLVPDNEQINFHDYVLNTDIQWESNEVSDITLLKTDGFPTYHLAVVVDDTEMKITHALRAVEWLPSTPVHLLTYRYLNLVPPEIGHLTAVLDPSGGKLSKRKSNVSVEQFIADGYLPEALLNFIILLGWAPKDNRELFTLEEFVQAFDPHGFQKSNPVFHTEKLDWFNGHYIRQKSDTELVHLVKPFMKNEITEQKIVQILPLIKERLVKLSDIVGLTDFFFAAPSYTPDLWPDMAKSADHLSHVASVLTNVSWDKTSIDAALLAHVDSSSFKRGDFFMSLRVAVCGSRFTPPLSEVMQVLGQEETLSRLQSALTFLSST